MLSTIVLTFLKISISILFILTLYVSFYFLHYYYPYTDPYTIAARKFRKKVALAIDDNYNFRKIQQNINKKIYKLLIFFAILLAPIIILIILFRNSLKSYISVLFIETIPYVLAYVSYEVFFYYIFTQHYDFIHQDEILSYLITYSKQK